MIVFNNTGNKKIIVALFIQIANREHYQIFLLLRLKLFSPQWHESLFCSLTIVVFYVSPSITIPSASMELYKHLLKQMELEWMINHTAHYQLG